jgi:hypothetical protein
MYAGKGNTKGREKRVRQPKPEQLALDIAYSIRQHAEMGITRKITHYTTKPEMIEMVQALLDA